MKKLLMFDGSEKCGVQFFRQIFRSSFGFLPVMAFLLVYVLPQPCLAALTGEQRAYVIKAINFVKEGLETHSQSMLNSRFYPDTRYRCYLNSVKYHASSAVVILLTLGDLEEINQIGPSLALQTGRLLTIEMSAPYFEVETNSKNLRFESLSRLFILFNAYSNSGFNQKGHEKFKVYHESYRSQIVQLFYFEVIRSNQHYWFLNHLLKFEQQLAGTVAGVSSNPSFSFQNDASTEQVQGLISAPPAKSRRNKRKRPTFEAIPDSASSASSPDMIQSGSSQEIETVRTEEGVNSELSFGSVEKSDNKVNAFDALPDSAELTLGRPLEELDQLEKFKSLSVFIPTLPDEMPIPTPLPYHPVHLEEAKAAGDKAVDVEYRSSQSIKKNTPKKFTFEI